MEIELGRIRIRYRVLVADIDGDFMDLIKKHSLAYEPHQGIFKFENETLCYQHPRKKATCVRLHVRKTIRIKVSSEHIVNAKNTFFGKTHIRVSKMLLERVANIDSLGLGTTIKKQDLLATSSPISIISTCEGIEDI